MASSVTTLTNASQTMAAAPCRHGSTATIRLARGGVGPALLVTVVMESHAPGWGFVTSTMEGVTPLQHVQQCQVRIGHVTKVFSQSKHMNIVSAGIS